MPETDVRNEFPKIVYKGKKTRSVANAEEEQNASLDGYGPYDHAAFTAEEK